MDTSEYIKSSLERFLIKNPMHFKDCEYLENPITEISDYYIHNDFERIAKEGAFFSEHNSFPLHSWEYADVIRRYVNTIRHKTNQAYKLQFPMPNVIIYMWFLWERNDEKYYTSYDTAIREITMAFILRIMNSCMSHNIHPHFYIYDHYETIEYIMKRLAFVQDTSYSIDHFMEYQYVFLDVVNSLKKRYQFPFDFIEYVNHGTFELMTGNDNNSNPDFKLLEQYLDEITKGGNK